MGWRSVFPNEKCEFLAGCIGVRRAGWHTAQKGGPAGCRKGQGGLQERATLLPALSTAQLNVQPAGPP